jgi:hypothetical protein
MLRAAPAAFLAVALATAGSALAASPLFSPAEQAAMARVGADEISGHLRFLADDLLEGRAPGSRGGEIAVRYLAAQLEAMGFSPGVPGSSGAPPSWFQQVPLVQLTGSVPEKVQVQGPNGTLELSTRGGTRAELLVRPGDEVDRVRLDAAELVFVGYGITAPEFGWDDYRGADVRGKVVVILNFNPPFQGEGVRLWYGRWDYKYLNAARHGAVAAVVVHTTSSAGYPWQVLTASNDFVEMALPPEPGEPRLGAKMWIAEPAARRLFALGGQDLDAQTRAARDPERRGLGPRPLGLRVSLDMPVARKPTPSANVVGLLPGSDPGVAGEYVIFSAHHDHLGVSAGPEGTDRVHNGALDNASGCAAVLAIARAAAAAPPRRSILVLFTTAEEKGLLGARWFAQRPPADPGRLAAVINLDGVNIHGRTIDVGLLGLGKSSVDAVVAEAAAAQGRSVHGDAFPDRGAFYRSDHFELARVGVPAVYLRGGPHYVGRPPEWGAERQREFETERYHQPSDEYPPAPQRWDLSGAVEDAQLQLVVGLRIANAPELPRWTPGDEFEKARLRAQR